MPTTKNTKTGGPESERARSVLEAVVVYYIQTSEPVGSRSLSKLMSLGVSAGTIRNIMADLTYQGFFSQSHASSGRIPTHKAYRMYVDSLSFSAQEDNLHPSLVSLAPQKDLETLLPKLVSLLSGLTQLVAIATPPSLENNKVKFLQLFPWEKNTLCVLFITQSQMLFKRMLSFEEELPLSFCQTLNHFFEKWAPQKQLEELQQNFMQDFINQGAYNPQDLGSLIRLGKKLLEFEAKPKLYASGHSHLMESMLSPDELTRIFKLLEEPHPLLQALEDTKKEGQPWVLIGNECPLEEFGPFSLVSQAYETSTSQQGVVGVLGPTCMDYAEVLPLVQASAQVLSHTLQKN